MWSWPWLAIAQPMPELSVTIVGRHQTYEGLPADNALFLQLGVSEASSTNGAASGSTDELLPVQVESEPQSLAYGDVPSDPLEGDDAVTNATPESKQRRRRDAPTQAADEQSSAPFVLTPVFVQKAVDAAMSTQGIHSSLGRLEGLASRSRTSALLPEVRFRAGRNADQSLRLAPTADDPYRYTQSGGVSVILEGAATFRLNRLLFANEELGIERLRLAQSRERQRITENLLDELLAWQQAYRIMAVAALASNRALVQLRESSLRLDVMTGGWFSEHEPVLPREPKPALRTAPSTPVVEPSSLVTPGPNRALPAPKRVRGPRQADLSKDWAGNDAERGALVKLATSR